MELIIDGHSHVMYPLNNHLKEMDENGVSKTILFRTSIHPEQLNSFPQIKEEMSKLNVLLNGDPSIARNASAQSAQELIAAIQLYPDRFLAFGYLPPTLSKEKSIQGIQENILAHGLIGLGEYTLPSGSVPQMDALFYASRECGNLPIWIHGFNPLLLSDIQAIHALAKAYPSVPVIIGHMGGSNWLESLSLVQDSTNLYMDISAFFSTLALKIVINTIPDRCIFGVDLPYGDLGLSIRAVQKYAESAYVRENIFSNNILSILP